MPFPADGEAFVDHDGAEDDPDHHQELVQYRFLPLDICKCDQDGHDPGDDQKHLRQIIAYRLQYPIRIHVRSYIFVGYKRD